MRIVTLSATILLVALCSSEALAATLHPGDKIDVLVYNHPELSGTRTLDAAGSVSLPLAGTVAASGVEPNVLAQRVQARLAPYVRHAAVDVRLDEQTASIFVDGGPVGVLRYEPGETLTNVVEQLADGAPRTAPAADAGSSAPADASKAPPLDLYNGPQDFARVRLERDGNTSAPYDLLAMRAAGDGGPALQPGDTILIAHKPVAVTVLGDVEKPGTAYLDANEPLQQAIRVALVERSGEIAHASRRARAGERRTDDGQVRERRIVLDRAIELGLRRAHGRSPIRIRGRMREIVLVEPFERFDRVADARRPGTQLRARRMGLRDVGEAHGMLGQCAVGLADVVASGG